MLPWSASFSDDFFKPVVLHLTSVLLCFYFFLNRGTYFICASNQVLNSHHAVCRCPAFCLLFVAVWGESGVGLFVLLTIFISNIFQLIAGFTLIVLSCNIYPTVLWLLLQSSYLMNTSHIMLASMHYSSCCIWFGYNLRSISSIRQSHVTGVLYLIISWNI